MLNDTTDNATVERRPQVLRECYQREVFHEAILKLLEIRTRNFVRPGEMLRIYKCPDETKH